MASSLWVSFSSPVNSTARWLKHMSQEQRVYHIMCSTHKPPLSLNNTAVISRNRFWIQTVAILLVGNPLRTGHRGLEGIVCCPTSTFTKSLVYSVQFARGLVFSLSEFQHHSQLSNFPKTKTKTKNQKLNAWVRRRKLSPLPHPPRLPPLCSMRAVRALDIWREHSHFKPTPGR